MVKEVVFLLFVAILQRIYCQVPVAVTADVSLVEVQYDRRSSTTEFTYSVGSSALTYWVLGLERCSQIRVVGAVPSTPLSARLDDQTQISGIKWSGKVATYRLRVSGHVASGPTTFGIVYGAYKSTTGVVDGPICSYYEDVVCNAGGPYYADCHNNQMSVHLLGHGSLHSLKYKWNHFIPGATLFSPSSVASVLTLPTNICLETFRVSLSVSGLDSSDWVDCIAYVMVEDSTPPTIHNIYERDISAEPHDIPVPMLLTAEDECDPSVAIKFREERVENNKPCAYQLHRFWVATDQCGNVAMHTQIISVMDTEPPTLSGVDADATYSCDVVPPPCTVEGNDYNEVSVEIRETRSDGPCECIYSLTRKWIATDCAGNTATKSQKIEVTDDAPPTIYGVPADTTAECDEIPSVPSPSAVDNCCGATLRYFDSKVAGSCVNNYDIVRSWTASDACGNTEKLSQTIIVKDDTPPTLSGVGDSVTVECDEIPLPCEVDASDNCDKYLNIVFTEHTSIGTCTDEYQINWSWTAEDVCGNIASSTQMVSVVDSTPPILNGLPPSSLTVECDSIPQFVVIASDNCDFDINVDEADGAVNKLYVHDYTIVKSWDATDECGNTVHYESTITVQDNDDPVLIGVPDDMHTSCDNVPDASSVEGTDNCCEDYSLVPTFSSSTVPGTCPNSYLLINRWDLEDCSHNYAYASQTITVEDSEAPILHGLPGYVVVKCDEIPEMAFVSVTDNCEDELTPTYDENYISGSCKTQSKILRTWSAADVCGNSASYTQTIVSFDDSAPNFESVPADVTVDCVFDPLAYSDPTVVDNCDDYLIVQSNEKRVDGTCEYDLKMYRDWFVEDDCGNAVSASQTVTVQDIEAPTWTLTPDEMINSEYPEEPEPTPPTSEDNCDYGAEITFNERKLQFGYLCPKAYRLVRAWFVIDLCGNMGSPVYQHVVIDDTQAPTFLASPPHVTVECDDIPPPFPLNAVDHYEEIVVDLTETTDFGTCNQDYDIVRKWLAVDSCGNSVSFEQVITVQDTTPPRMYAVPVDMTAECQAPPPAVVSAEDNCDGYLDVSLVSDGEVLDGTYETAIKVVSRTWSVSDNCGNTKEASQKIEVFDTEYPYFGQYDSDILAECDDVPGIPDNIVARDDCDANPTSWFEGSEEGGTCEQSGYLYRAWYVQDSVGHESTFSQTVTIVDTTPPVLAGYKEDTIDVECDSVPTYHDMSATDNCDQDVPVIWVDTKVDPDYMCDDQYILFWTWTAADDCGNSATYTKTINVDDTTPPTLHCDGSFCIDYVGTFDVECDDQFLVEVLPVTAVDLCDDDVEVKETHVTEHGTCDHEYLKISTYIAVDDCGNTDTYIRTITVVDSTPPTWVVTPDTVRRVPYDGVLSCPTDLEAVDACEYNVGISCNAVIENGICPQDYTKTCNCKGTDNCGNIVEFVQVINVFDDEPPSIHSVPETTVECLTNLVHPPQPPVDWGYGSGQLTVKQTTTANGCDYTVVYTWTAVDDCKLKTVLDQTVIVVDINPPVILNVPDDETVECHPGAPSGYLSGEDDCDGKVMVLFDEEKIDVLGQYCYTLVRTWQAVDHCGHVTVESQTIVVDDVKPPVVSYPPAQLTTDCHSLPFASEDDISSDDNCEEHRNVTFSDLRVDGSCECEWTQYRSWDVCDSCGNCVTVTQTVVVQDDLPPSLSLYPSDLTVQTGDVPYPQDVVGLDTYGSEVDVTYIEDRENSTYVASSTWIYKLYRTWTAEDDCLNQESKSQTITVIDTIPVQVVGVPKDVTLECVQVGDIPTIYGSAVITALIETNVASEGDVTVTISQDEMLPGTCDNEWTWIRCWETEDHAFNTNVACFTINTVDNVPPHFTLFPEVEFQECQPPPVEDVRDGVQADDNCFWCPPTINVDVEDFTNGVYSGYYVRTWIATDCCGLTTAHAQTIWIADTSAPVWDTLPSDKTACCEDVPDPDSMTAKDVCHPDIRIVEINWKEVICEGEYTLFYSWRAIDNEGNWISAQQQIHVSDCAPPVLYAGDFSSYQPGSSVLIGDSGDHTSVQHECPWIENHHPVYAKDECIPYAWDVPLYSIDRWGDDCLGWVAFSWISSDDCGNEASFAQTITIKDDTAPVISGCPIGDETLHCGTPLNNPYVAGLDDCDPNIIVDRKETIVTGSCDHQYQVEIVWSIQDRCGFKDSCSHTVSYKDLEDPVLTLHAPSSMTSRCDQPYDVPSVSAIDDCQDYFDIDYEQDQVDGTCPCEYTWYRTWTTKDKCGKVASVTQTVVVVDEEPPVLSDKPKDVTVPCLHEPPKPPMTTSDNCCEVTLDYKQETKTLTCVFNYQLVRTWTATDDCGHTAEYAYTVTVIDTDEPTFTLGEFLPKYIKVECENVPLQVSLTAYDVCSGPVAVTPQEFTHNNECDDSFFLIRHWDAGDACGNTIHLEQTISVVDNTPPVIVVPDVDSYECNYIPTVDNHNVEATDNCDPDPHVSYNSNILGADCSNSWSVMMMWVTTDRCGNEAIFSLVVDVGDTLYPVLSGVPSDATVECVLPDVEHVSVTDDCDKLLTAHFEQELPYADCPYVYLAVRRWIAVDRCQNAVEASQTIKVNDDGPPTLEGVPEDETIDCKDHVVVAHVVANDNCESLVKVDVDQTVVPGSCPFQYVTIITWTAQDKCGNIVTDTQTVTVHDNSPPVVSTPVCPESVSCDAIPGYPFQHATDGCSYSLEVKYEENILPGTCENDYEIVRRWSAEDECGNSHFQDCTIAVTDEVDPEFVGYEGAENRTDPCNDVTPMATYSAVDNCGGYVQYTQEESTDTGTCEYDYTLVRSYEAIDACGNSVSKVYTVTVVDNEDPTLLYAPGDETNECDTYSAAVDLEAQDSCGYAPTVFPFDWTIAGTCEEEYTKINTWTASDECGLTDQHVQTVHYVDTTPPIIDEHEDVTCEIGNIPPPWKCTWKDNCDSDGQDDFTPEINPGSCDHQYSITYVCDAIDCSGNLATTSHVVHVFDLTPPVIVGVEDDITVEYQHFPDAMHALKGVSSTDNSDGSNYDSELTVKDDVRIPGYDANDYIVIRTYVATDSCDNRVEVHRTITVVDKTPPCFDEYPVDLTVECDAIPEPCDLYTIGEDINVEFYEGNPSSSDYITIVKRFWKACDHSGNCHEWEQYITIEDTVPPVFTRCPADTTFSCDCESFPAMASLAAIDNCDEFVVVTKDEDESEVVCDDSYTLTRTWTAVDHHGLTTFCIQMINVTDTESPTFIVEPTDVTFQCDSITVNGAPKYSISDNCDDDPSIREGLDDFDVITDCEIVLHNDVETVDVCGNADERHWHITVQDNDPPEVSHTKECVHVTSHDGYGSSSSYKTYNLDDLTDYSDTCSQSYIYGVWFNRSIDDRTNLLDGGTWEKSPGSIDNYNCANLVNGDFWETIVSTVAGRSYYFSVIALQTKCTESLGAPGMATVEVWAIRGGSGGSEEMIQTRTISPTHSASDESLRYTIYFGAVTNLVKIKIGSSSGVSFGGIAAIINFHLRFPNDFIEIDPEKALTELISDHKPTLRSYNGEGLWERSLNSSQGITCNVGPIVVTDLTHPCSALDVSISGANAETGMFEALASFREDRYCYKSVTRSWRTITHYIFPNNDVYWFVTDFAGQNPSAYSWLSVASELAKNINRGKDNIENLDSLKSAGTILSYWKEEVNNSPVITIWGKTVTCPDPNSISSLQCQGACYFQGYSNAILSAANSGESWNTCKCGGECSSNGQFTLEVSTIYKWLEGFFYEPSTNEVWILADSHQDADMKISMWYEVLDGCGNSNIGSVQFWIAPSLEAAAAAGRTCDEPDTNPGSYDELVGFSSHEIVHSANVVRRVPQNLAFAVVEQVAAVSNPDLQAMLLLHADNTLQTYRNIFITIVNSCPELKKHFKATFYWTGDAPWSIVSGERSFEELRLFYNGACAMTDYECLLETWQYSANVVININFYDCPLKVGVHSKDVRSNGEISSFHCDLYFLNGAASGNPTGRVLHDIESNAEWYQKDCDGMLRG